MRTLFLLALFTACLRPGATSSQEVAFLDATAIVPAHRIHEPISGRVNGGFAVMGDTNQNETSSLQVTLLPLERSTFRVGEEIVYEVSIENVSSSPKSIPWDPYVADIEPSGPVESYKYDQVSISLWFTNAQKATDSSQVVVLYGTERLPRTRTVLRPGQSARIKAKAQPVFHEKRFPDCTAHSKLLVRANLTFAEAKLEKRGDEYFEELTSDSRPNLSRNSQSIDVLPNCGPGPG